MLKDKELQQAIDTIRNDIHTIMADIMKIGIRLDNTIADTRLKMDSVEKHITPMHNRLDNMHSDISRLSFNIQDAIKKNNEKNSNTN